MFNVYEFWMVFIGWAIFGEGLGWCVCYIFFICYFSIILNEVFDSGWLGFPRDLSNHFPYYVYFGGGV